MKVSTRQLSGEKEKSFWPTGSGTMIADDPREEGDAPYGAVGKEKTYTALRAG